MNPRLLHPRLSLSSMLLIGCVAIVLAGCANNIDSYTNPATPPPYGTEPTMDVGATGPMAPPPAADGTF